MSALLLFKNVHIYPEMYIKHETSKDEDIPSKY